jgi:membrane-associated protease RseP (regulator of RpoE activity)
MLALAGVAACAAGLMATAGAARAQSLAMAFANPAPTPGSAQGYLGVSVADVDRERAQALKLKEVRGAVITLVDHDAPAGQAGLKVNDVVLQLNGQNVEGAEQLRRMLREIPPGRKATLAISRDGALQTVTVELGDRRAIDRDAWNRIGSGEVGMPPTSMGILGGGDAPMPGGFHFPFFGNSLKVGALVEPLTSQMASYLGVESGLMVKQVARKSEAEAAGLRAFDVILKVGSEPIATSADWDRALRSNEGKPVQVTILRDRKQQTLTLQVDSKRHQGVAAPAEPPAEGDELAMGEMNARINAEIAEALAAQAETMRKQARALEEQLQTMQPWISAETAEQLRQQAEKLRESMKDFRIDPKQMDQIRRQMEEFKQQMEEWRERQEEKFV